ncbi:pentapeptide repeat-containing protein [Glycomyces sp. NPDC047369]
MVPIEGIRTFLTVMAGIVGFGVLLVALRRQQHHETTSFAQIEQQERALRQRELDDEQRRIIELRIRATEQIGSEKAAVRIGGLHNLDHLGENYPELRQVVISEICAYLRMPFHYSSILTQDTIPVVRELGARQFEPIGPARENPSKESFQDALQEQQVRKLAQSILSRRLRRNLDTSSSYWDHAYIDLMGAYLDDLDLSDCCINNGNFEGAIFDGETRFVNADFCGEANFNDTTFKGRADFRATYFASDAFFNRSKFVASAAFQKVTFAVNSIFRGAKFMGNSSFGRVRCYGYAIFRGAYFHAPVSFSQALFFERCRFDGAQFKDDASFREAVFRRFARFPAASFSATADFARVYFRRFVSFHMARFSGSTRLSEAVFNRGFQISKCLFRLDDSSTPPKDHIFSPVTDYWEPGWNRVIRAVPNIPETESLPSSK